MLLESLLPLILLYITTEGAAATIVSKQHRRKINTEEKAKVVDAVWGTAFIQFLAELAFLH